MYALIDHHSPVEDVFRTAQTERLLVLRRELVERIKILFAKNATVFHVRDATARKLAVLLHRLWVSGEAYEPLRNSRG